MSSSRLTEAEENKMTSDLEAKFTCLVVLCTNSLWSRTREVLNDRKQGGGSFTTNIVVHVMQNANVVKKLKKKHLFLTHKYTKISLT